MLESATERRLRHMIGKPMTDPLPYIPADYQSVTSAEFTLWHSPAEPAANLCQARETIARAERFCRQTLEFNPRRQLHICCFASNEEACRALDRQLHPAMALAPFTDGTAALVVIQSPAADPRNGDPTRMLRVMAHEICHQYTAEVTESVKRLGDANRHLRIRTWLNEGLAEVIGNLAGNRTATLEQARDRWRQSAAPMTFDELDQHLDDLNSPQRALAFSHATAAVHELTRHQRLPELFFDLRRLDARYSGDQLCTPALFDLDCRSTAP